MWTEVTKPVNCPALLGTVVLSCVLLAQCTRGGPVALVTTSPQHNYVVEVRGLLSRPSNPFSTNRLTFTARRDSSIVATGTLYEADSMDDGFGEIYPEHNWPAENVLLFLSTARKYFPISDRLTIANSSSHRIAFARIVYCNLYLVLDLEPGTVLHINAPRDSAAAVSVEAQLDGFKNVLYAGKGLSYSSSLPSTPVDVAVGVGESEIKLSVGPPGSVR